MWNEEEQKICLGVTETMEQTSETNIIDTDESDIDDSSETSTPDECLTIAENEEQIFEEKNLVTNESDVDDAYEGFSFDESSADDSNMAEVLKGISEKESEEQRQSDDVYGDVKNSIDSINEKINDFNNHTVLKDLTKQLVENEIQKREFKIKLMKYIKIMIFSQMILIAIPILLLTSASFLNITFLRNIDSNGLSIFCDFLKYYISAVIVEFIAMLFFIVKYVFDKSITELVKEYKISD